MADYDSIQREDWRSVEGYDGLYEVSENGSVRSLRFRNRNIDAPRLVPLILKGIDSGNGYLRVALQAGNVSRLRSIHRIVLIAFRGPAPAGCEAMHLDGTRTNNRLSNLAWGTRKENHSHKIQHGTTQRGIRQWRARFTEKDVLEIRAAVSAGVRQTDLADEFGVTKSAIHAIVARKSWAHL